MPRSLPAVLATALVLLLPTAAAHAADVSGTAWDEMSTCAALGPKHPGSAANRKLGDHLLDRFRAAGLQTSAESFHMPVWEPRQVTLSVLGAGGGPMVAESFAYGGTGSAEGEVVDVGSGRPTDYTGKDVKGKIVMVKRDEAYHRTVQVKEIVAHGGVAMLYVSTPPDNLIQTGAVSWANRPPAAIPTVTVGADDGTALRDRIQAGGLRVRLSVAADRVDAVARNIIGVRPGTTHPDKYVVVGAHYDSWHSGAVDNCTAVGSLLQMVDATKDLDPAYTVIFAGWDAEEPGMIGSYAWLRRHPEIVANTVLNENLEMTSAVTYSGSTPITPVKLNLASGTLSPALNALLVGAAAKNLFSPIIAPLTVYRALSGGLIATDTEGFYGQGVQGFSTATTTPYYHTTQDTADKVDPTSLADVTSFLTTVLEDAQGVAPEALLIREVPTVKVTAPATAAPGAAVPVDLQVTNVDGTPATGLQPAVLADQNGNWAIAEGIATELGGGRYRWTLPAGSSRADVTELKATVSEDSYLGVGFGRIDQRTGAAGGGAGAGGGSGTGGAGGSGSCRSRRVVTFSVKLRARLGTAIRVKATTSRGKVRVLRTKRGGRQVRLDLRGLPKATVRVTLRVRTSRGKLVKVTKTYRSCAGA